MTPLKEINYWDELKCPRCDGSVSTEGQYASNLSVICRNATDNKVCTQLSYKGIDNTDRYALNYIYVATDNYTLTMNLDNMSCYLLPLSSPLENVIFIECDVDKWFTTNEEIDKMAEILQVFS